MRNKLKIFVALALLCVFIFLFSSCSLTKNDNYTENNSTIKIGMSAPLWGTKSEYGIAAKNSAQIAVDEINAMGGINGIKFELVVENDLNSDIMAHLSYQNLYKNGMQISLGTATNRPSGVFNENAYEDNVFILTPFASSDDTVLPYENVYQMCDLDSNQGALIAHIFNVQYEGIKIGVFYKSDDKKSVGVTESFLNNISNSFEKVTTASVSSLTSGSISIDYLIQANKLKDCDVVFMPVYDDIAVRFMKAAKDIIKPTAILYGTDDLSGVDSKENFDISSIPQSVAYFTTFNSYESKGREYVNKYIEKYGYDAPINECGANAYDSVHAIYEALKCASDKGAEIRANMSSSEFCDILKSVFSSDFEFQGVTNLGESVTTWDAQGAAHKIRVTLVLKESN